MDRVVFAFGLTVIAIVVFGASFAVGYARVHDGRILPGVQIAGVSLSGLDAAAAEAVLREELPSLSSGSLTARLGHLEESITYASFERDYDFDYMLAQAFDLGRAVNPLEQLQEQVHILMNGASVEPVMTWNSEELTSRVAALAVAAQVAPVDASITREGGRYVVTPASIGMSVDVEEAVRLAMAEVNNLSPAETHIAVEGTPVPPSVSTDVAQAAADRAERVVASGLTVSGAELSTTIDADTLRGWVHLEEVAHGQWQLFIEAGPISQYVASYGQQTDIPPTNASLRFKRGQIEVVPSLVGRAIDVEATTNSILAALNSRADAAGSDAGLVLVPVEPTLSTAEAQELAPRVRKLSEWTTRYTPGPSNGDGVNIQIPTSIIDGYVVEPGAQFDFITAIGPVTSPPYEAGGVLIRGQIVEDGAIGGGMCSVSTTLFNAALRAGLQIDERRNHSIYISRYPVGLDATIFEIGSSRQTMAFTNDTGYPVLIRGINGRGTVTFQLYGIDDGRTVKFSEPRIEDLVEGDAWLEYSDELPPGQRRSKQDRYDAFQAWVTWTVRDTQASIMYQETFYSKYKALPAITLVGRYPGDPVAGTRIHPDEYPEVVSP